MADVVAAFGVPHTPFFPDLVKREGAECETARLYRAVAQELARVRPEALIIFDSDHLNTFFLDNLPTFCIGLADHTEGPNDSLCTLPRRVVPVDEALAREVHRGGVAGGFDLASTQEFEVDHSVLVPLHFLTPDQPVPIVPVFINGIVPPLPGARRAFALGQAVRQAVDGLPRGLRVAVLASGSFSLEVGGPRVGWTDLNWLDNVLSRLSHAEIDELLNEATTERMLAAGNVSGELLNWIALLGVIGRRKPALLEPQRAFGHAYAAWRWD